MSRKPWLLCLVSLGISLSAETGSLTAGLAQTAPSDESTGEVEQLDPQRMKELRDELLQERAIADVEARKPEMTFSYQRWSAPYGGSIEADGMITRDSLARLEAAIAQGENEGGYIGYLKLNSRGGNLEAAIRMGELLRRKKISTVVDAYDVCLSACAIAFLGGEHRSVHTTYGSLEPNDFKQDRLGFHAFTFNRNITATLRPAEATEVLRDAERDTQLTLGDLARYVSSMGVDPKIIQLAAVYPIDTFLYPGLVQLNELGITTSDVDGGDFKLVPDGDRTNAIYHEEWRQLALACLPSSSGQFEPIAAFSMLILKDESERTEAWDFNFTVSKMLAGKNLPWTQRDLDHAHFHPPDHSFQNVPIGYMYLSDGDQDLSLSLSKDNMTIYQTDGALHVMVRLSQQQLAFFKRAKSMMAGLSESESMIGFSQLRFNFDNSANDQVNIAYATRECTPSDSIGGGAKPAP